MCLYEETEKEAQATKVPLPTNRVSFHLCFNRKLYSALSLPRQSLFCPSIHIRLVYRSTFFSTTLSLVAGVSCTSER